MHALSWLLTLVVVSLAACQGKPHASSPGAIAPAPDRAPASMADEPAPPDVAGEPAPPDVAGEPAPPAELEQDPELPGQEEPCPDGACKEGLTCVSYYGIAGASGPRFTSCELPCAGDPGACPKGQTCVTIADGPGTVCRAL